MPKRVPPKITLQEFVISLSNGVKGFSQLNFSGIDFTKVNDVQLGILRTTVFSLLESFKLKRQRNDFSGLNFRGSNLSYTTFTGANLLGASFRCANLRAADLRGVDLRGASLGGADLRSIDNDTYQLLSSWVDRGIIAAPLILTSKTVEAFIPNTTRSTELNRFTNRNTFWYQNTDNKPFADITIITHESSVQTNVDEKVVTWQHLFLLSV